MGNTKVPPGFHGKKGRSGRKKSPSTIVKEALLSVDSNFEAIFQSLIDKALEGDREAQIYLIDRRLGKPKAITEIETGEGLSKVAFAIAVKAIIEADKEVSAPLRLTEGEDNSDPTLL